MQFVSTRSGKNPVSFTEAMFRGLAPDGGLYRPVETPELGNFFQSLDKNATFLELAADFTAELLGPEISTEMARRICEDAFPFSPVLAEPGGGTAVLELFHGPSCAFKDFGASFLAASMNRLLADRDEHAIIVTATSGDTGSAVAQAFHGKKRIDVVILYPSGRVSPLQEKQLTTLGGNVRALEVQGNFDDCQRMAKAAFTDPALAALPLSSANSINLGRLIPQSFYYVWAWNQLRNRGPIAYVVPSGNFGNITAGLYAAAWGLPVENFVAATNANDVVPEYLHTGRYQPRPSVATYSNAMDVGAPSNYERLDVLFNRSVADFRKAVRAFSIDDEETLATIRRVDEDYGYLCCPHTAVGWRAAEMYKEIHPEATALVLATAHPGKFVEVVQKATGKTPALPPALARLTERQKEATLVGNSNKDLRDWLLGQFG